ncbi:MAG TPA: NAD(+) diphosphatase [Allosphingosinicella sp.]|jgi:NAD+ diphosphatase
MKHRPGFTGSTLDRADHLRLDPERIAQLAGSGQARLLKLSGADPVLDEGGRMIWSPLGEAERRGELLFLGLDGGSARFAPLPHLEPGQRAWSVFQLIAGLAPEEASVWAAARSLIEWHNRHGFCANCGGPARLFRAGWGRKCGTCASEHYPRVDPVVIMLAEFEGKVLLARQKQYPAGRFSALAGFVEPGESIEEAVTREFQEEAALEVSNIRYIASQPWPFPGSLMIACIADAATYEVTLDATELEAAIWVDEEEVKAALGRSPTAPFAAPPRFAIAHTLLLHWLDGR